MESARLDGAGELLIFIRIGIPLGSAGIISALVLGFLEYWNLIEQPMAFLKTKSLWPLSLYLPQIDISQTGKAFAVSVLVLIPAVIVFLAAGLSGTRDHIHGNQGIERQKREDLSMKKIKLIKILAGFLP